jgi:predicted DNA-binding antitoxin AbrB/MazE fold protein
MSELIMAIYDQGLLRPLKPLDLPDRQTVIIQVLSEVVSDKAEQVIQFLVKFGLLTPPSGHSQVIPVSESERQTIANKFAKAAAKPLSQMIIEERGEW